MGPRQESRRRPGVGLRPRQVARHGRRWRADVGSRRPCAVRPGARVAARVEAGPRETVTRPQDAPLGVVPVRVAVVVEIDEEPRVTGRVVEEDVRAVVRGLVKAVDRPPILSAGRGSEEERIGRRKVP